MTVLKDAKTRGHYLYNIWCYHSMPGIFVSAPRGRR